MPIRLIASFKRMKSLSKDIKVIAAALETSAELVVSGHRVRRKEPLPQVDETEALLRTAIVDNLPDQATIGAYILETYIIVYHLALLYVVAVVCSRCVLPAETLTLFS